MSGHFQIDSSAVVKWLEESHEDGVKLEQIWERLLDHTGQTREELLSLGKSVIDAEAKILNSMSSPAPVIEESHPETIIQPEPEA